MMEKIEMNDKIHENLCKSDCEFCSKNDVLACTEFGCYCSSCLDIIIRACQSGKAAIKKYREDRS